MPRIDRRVRRRGSVSIDQSAWLAIGMDFGGGAQLFENDAHELQIWLKIREEVMKEHNRPGSRPYGFFVHDLGVPAPNRWWEEVKILEEHKLLTPEEIVAIEKQHVQLGPGQSQYFMSSYLDPAKVRAMRLDVRSLRHLIESETFFAGWHARRGRPEVAKRCQRIADVARDVLEGTK